MEPPAATFLTHVFHPNVHWVTGEICLDVLKENWSPAWTLHYLCRALIVLLDDPNADSPFNCDAGNLLRTNDRRGFNALARMYSIEHAMGHLDPEARAKAASTPITELVLPAPEIVPETDAAPSVLARSLTEVIEQDQLSETQ